MQPGRGWELGEWTDDTSMAVPILDALARGERLDDAEVLGAIVREWRAWSKTAKDVGIQTRRLLTSLSPDATEHDSLRAARAVHEATGRSGGNGSLMRTGPVALGFLGGDAPQSRRALSVAARRLSDLTHYEQDAGDACVIWSLAIRHAILSGEYDVRSGIEVLPEARRARWHQLLDVAESNAPRDIPGSNGWVVAALQAAWSAIVRGEGLLDTLERAVRCGHDTDTVAAIAGSLAGAKWGASALPWSLRRHLHGWPRINGDELVRRAALAARGGHPDDDGWPSADRFSPTPLHAPVRHPFDDGVWLGALDGLDHLPEGVDAVVSLCRTGRAQTPGFVQPENRDAVWLIDRPGRNADPEFVLADTADAIATLRAESRVVYVHCYEARSRTPSVAAAYAVRHRGIDPDAAFDAIARVLLTSDPKEFLVDAVRRLGGPTFAG
nr:ADP-ribosylglycohydrolase family protein [Humibacter ginsenosidimutans]